MQKLIKDLEAGDRFELYPGSTRYTVAMIVWQAPEELLIVPVQTPENDAHASMMARWSEDTVETIPDDPEVEEIKVELMQTLRDGGVPRELLAPVGNAALGLHSVDELEQLIGSVTAQF